MEQYLTILQNILDNGREKESGRPNMPNTIGLSRATVLMNLQDGYPLLTTKKMFWKGIVHELLWFLRGETNIKYLVDNGVNIWNGDAYRWYQKHYEKDGRDKLYMFSMDEFIEKIKNGELTYISKHSYKSESGYKLGDLGKVYGYQWRNQNGVDQIKDIINDLNNNPFGRYKILDGWNKRDFPEMALPPCHLLYQFIVRPMTLVERYDYLKNNCNSDEWIVKHYKEPKSHEYFDSCNVPKYFLDLNMYQRSCDMFLGVPFNLASMSLLLMIVAKTINMLPGEAFWIGGDTHIYKDHIDVVKEQLKRKPMKLPQMNINKELNSLEDIENLTINDFELKNYKSHSKLKAKLFTGYKK